MPAFADHRIDQLRKLPMKVEVEVAGASLFQDANGDGRVEQSDQDRLFDGSGVRPRLDFFGSGDKVVEGIAHSSSPFRVSTFASM